MSNCLVLFLYSAFSYPSPAVRAFCDKYTKILKYKYIKIEQVVIEGTNFKIQTASYGSVQEHGMEKFMKSPMYKKETTDEKYHENPFRAVNFKTDSGEELICPNGRKFHLAYRKPVKGNQYGRQEEYYTCEDCSECHNLKISATTIPFSYRS